ncbi:sensor histidine kinase [Bradyrhizobium sp. LeoA1S1]
MIDRPKGCASLGDLLAILVCLFALCVFAREGDARELQPTAIVGPSGELPLDGYMELFVDPSRTLDLGDVLRASAQFLPISGHGINLGYTTDAAWLRIRVGAGEWQRVLLSLTPNFVDLVDVYVAADRPGLAADDFKHYATGDHRPFSADDTLSGLDNVVPLQLQPDTAMLVYIRLASVNSSLNLSAVLYSPTVHTFRVTIQGLVAGAWFGGMAVLLIIQLVFFHFDRKPSYPLLAFSILGATLVYVGNLGLSRMLLFPNGGYGNDYFTGAAAWLGLLASSLATASILELPQRLPWMNRIFLAGAGVGFIGIVFVGFNANLVFAPFGGVVILILVTLALVLALFCANENGVDTRLRAAAYWVLWFGVAGTVVQRAGFVELPDWVAHTYALPVLLQMVLLSGAVAVRLRSAEAMNAAMSTEMLLAAQAAERRAVAMVEEKTRELAAAKKIAEDALRAELQSQEQQVRFMEVISHQYRTPLATIRSNIDGIGLSLPVEDQANHDRLKRVRRGIVRLIETLEVNLTRSRLQGPSFSPQLVRTSLQEVVLASAARANDLLQADILTDAAPRAAHASIMADPEMLGIAIINLLENAVKFSIHMKGDPVILSCSIAGDSGVIAVTDKGIGIPPDEIVGIMRRSVRGSNARHVEGTGMGLSLVSRIAGAHGGTIEIDSKVGVGTTIRIIVPLPST